MGSERNTLVLEVLTEGDLLGVRYVLHPDRRVLFGRTAGADVVIPHVAMSRRHCWFYFEDGKWRIEDAGSTSGVYVDEVACGARPTEVPYASLVRIGGVRFIARRGAPDLQPTVPLDAPARTSDERSLAHNESPLLQRQGEIEVFADRFELQGSLGRGTRSVAYKAFDRRERTSNESGLHVLKIYDPGMTVEQEAQFLRAAGANATRLETNFVPHRSCGVTGGRAWLAMEEVVGLRLSDRLSRQPLTMLESVKVARKLAFAVGKLHEEGFLHRNIKPDNVLLWKGDPEYPHLSDVLVDIGPRKAPDKEPPPASFGFVAVNPAVSLDFAASDDVFSLAAILYLCVAGCMPVAPHDPDRARRLWSPLREAQDLREVRPDAPPALAELLHRALSPHRQDRPQTGMLLGYALFGLEKALGHGEHSPPFRVASEHGGPRRAVIAPRARVDPFKDDKFQEEILELARPRCPPDTTWGMVYPIFKGHPPAQPSERPGCALCGLFYHDVPVVEIRPNGFSTVAAEDAKGAREPFLCHWCMTRDHGAAARAILDTADALKGRDDEPNRPLGPTRKELRDGILALYASARPTLDVSLKCPECGRTGETLRGVRASVCLRCVAKARGVENEWFARRKREADEELRKAYAKLFVRAEARRKSGLLLWNPTPEDAVKLPALRPFASISDGFTEYQAIDILHSPSREAVDRCALAIAGAIDKHTLTALARADRKDTGDPSASLCHSGVPRLAQDYLAHYEPGPEARERLVTAIFVMSELLRAGYRFVGKKDDYEWAEDTVYFLVFHDLADGLAGT